MMYLDIDGKLALPQPFNQMELPQWSLPVHQVGMFRRNKRQQLPYPPRRWQCFETEVVLQIQMLVFHPDWLAEPVIQALVERRRYFGEVPEPVGELGDVIIRCVLGKRKQLKTAHMHGLLPLFQP